MNETVITDVGGSVAYAIAIGLIRCIAVVQKLKIRIGIGCDGTTLITPLGSNVS